MSKKFLAAATAAAALLAMAGAASATTLFNTGYDAAGAEIVGVGADAHWTVSGAGTGISGSSVYTGATNGVFPISPWVADDSTSRWVTPTGTASDSFDPNVNGTYSYTQSFSLTGAQAAGAAFTGQFAADNRVESILLNGASIYTAGLGANDFADWTNFGANSGFQSGLNTLTFNVVNYGQNGGNPTGLNVRFLTEPGAVPEPATWAMMLTGFFGIGAMLRSRPKAAVLAA